MRAPRIADRDGAIRLLSSADQRRSELILSLEKGIKKPPSNGVVHRAKYDFEAENVSD